MFKDVKAGDTLHVVEINPSSGVPSYYVTSVVSVKMDNIASPAFPQTKEMSLVCSLSGGETDLSKIDPQSSVVKVGVYKIGIDKEWAMNEIRVMHDVNRANVDAVDKYKSIMSACAEILATNGLSPQSDSQRLTSLEESVSELKNGMGDIQSMLTSLVNELTPQKNEKTSSEPSGV